MQYPTSRFHLLSLGLLWGAWVTSPALASAAPTGSILPLMLSWWPSHSSGIFKTSGVPWWNWTLTNSLSWTLFRDSIPATLHPMTLSSFQNQVPPSLTASLRYNLGHIWNTASVCWPWGKTSQKKLNDSHSLITADPSALADQHQLSQPGIGLTSVALVSC